MKEVPAKVAEVAIPHETEHAPAPGGDSRQAHMPERPTRTIMRASARTGAHRATRVLLADSPTLAPGAVEKLLSPACEIVGRAGDGHTLVAEVNRLKPDVVVLD